MESIRPLKVFITSAKSHRGVFFRFEPRLLFSEPFFFILSLTYLDAAPAPWAVKVTLQFTM